MSPAQPDLNLAAYVAARLEGVPARRHGEYFAERLGIAVSGQQAERAARPVRSSSPWKGQRGRPGARRAKSVPALEDWLLVDEQRLGLEKSVVTIRGDGRGDADLVRRLAGIAGVRQVIELAHRRDLSVVAVTRDADERLRLRALISELTSRPVYWDEVLYETHAPARHTWARLARGLAVEQGRLSEAPRVPSS